LFVANYRLLRLLPVKERRTSKYTAMSMHCSGGFLKGARAHNRDIKVLCDYEHIHVYGYGEEDIRPVVF
jgi:hypothetical protein